MSGSGISWAICKSAPRSRQMTMPAPHHSVFLQAGWRSCRPTNSVKALKANTTNGNCCSSCLLLLIMARYLDSLSQVVAFIKLLGDTNCTVSYLAAHHYRLCRLVFSITDDSWWHQLQAVYYYYPATPAYHATNANNWNTPANDNNGIHTVYCYSVVLCGQDYRPLQDFFANDSSKTLYTLSYCHVSIRHKPVLYWNDWKNRDGFWHGGFHPPVQHCATRKFRVLPSWTLSQAQDLANFATASRSCCQQNSSSYHHQRWSLLTTPIRQLTSRGCLLQVGRL